MTDSWYADVILPLAVRGRFTYALTEDQLENTKPGALVRVPFGGSKIISGIVASIHNNTPAFKNIKTIAEIHTAKPVVNEYQLKLWKWISEYYLCSEGEVMRAAIPADIETENFNSKLEVFIKLADSFTEGELNGILDNLSRAPRQQDLLSSYLRLTGYCDGSEIKNLSRRFLLKETGSSPVILNSLIDKKILCSESLPVMKSEPEYVTTECPDPLSKAQIVAIEEIRKQFTEKDIVLLHGVTSSGKTEIYIHLIEEQLKKGMQVLYMLPEIALTTQIIQRLKRHFGSVTAVYHSRISDSEKAELWRHVAGDDENASGRLILGVRSSLFLPFSKLGLVIVDEEHDGSYKQHDPAPRYNGRDTAIMLASIHKTKTLLGSASPSIETYHNAMAGKYGIAELNERFGKINLPNIILADTRQAYRRKLMVSHFTPELLNAMDEALGKKEQIILFRNRRGFSPYIECSDCGWIPVCVQCAVNLTYHKSINRLVCHYCGLSSTVPSNCGNCSSGGMTTRGYGTEKIEDEIKIVFPSARVARMDQDTTRSKNSFNKIIRSLEEGRIDILIGTQMISKGLDFENLTVVGILNADNLLNFPDFRAHERSFQLMEQVSGRAGRRQKQGKVIIQTSDTSNKIIRLVVRHDYKTMFSMQSDERKTFNYPPFCRIIKLIIKHKDRASLNLYSDMLGNELKRIFGKRVLGPESPVVDQVQAWYIKNIMIKLEKERPSASAKMLLLEAVGRIEKEKGASSLRINIDVDPY